MIKGLIAVMIILVVLIFGTVFFSASTYNINMSENGNHYKLGNYADNNQVQENNPINSCGGNQYSYECFRYKTVEQEVGSGKSYAPEQTRLEPCQPLPKRCELCFDSPEQTSGNGKDYVPEQVRKNC